MAFADITKQLAEQAIGTVLKPSPAAGTTGATIVGQVQAMQKALKDDGELAVFLHAGGETIRVMEFYLPSWNVAVLKGLDVNKTLTRVVCAVESLQLVCKVMKPAPGINASRIEFVLPKS